MSLGNKCDARYIAHIQTKQVRAQRILISFQLELEFQLFDNDERNKEHMNVAQAIANKQCSQVEKSTGEMAKQVD